jgi:hypothetical protein
MLGVITEVQEAVRYYEELLKEKQGELGIATVGVNNRFRLEYPAVTIIAGPRTKQQHATHQFQVFMEVHFMVYHARLDKSHSQRTYEDLELVTNIENLVEADDQIMRLGGSAVFAFVRDILPDPIARSATEILVRTRMIVQVETRKGFPYGSHA